MSPAPRIHHAARATLMAFLIHHNPFYLLSALSMIAGCYALNAGLDLRSGQVGRVLVLLGTINVYEIMLLALGVYLIKLRDNLRDGRTLLLLQTVFLLDLTFLSSEIMTGRLTIGVPMSAAMLVLALAKVAFVLRGLSVRFPTQLFVAIALELIALFVIPCVLKWISHGGYVSARQFYVVWWAIAAIPVFIELHRRFATHHNNPGPTLRPRIGSVYACMGFISLIAHVGMLHWVYKAPYHLADVSPILLGLAFASASLKPSKLLPAGELLLMRWALPAAAIVFAINAPPSIAFSFAPPMMLTLASAYVTFVYLFFLHRAIILLSAGALAALVVPFGPTIVQADAILRTAVAALMRIVPRTAIQWGVVGITGAFAFLGIGAAVSVTKRRDLDRQTFEPPTKADQRG